MTYKPKRDYRFEYTWELMDFIEDNQCRTCVFSKLQDPDEDMFFAEEYPMCHDVEGQIILEEPVDALDDQGDDGVVCTWYENVEVAAREHPDQTKLF